MSEALTPARIMEVGMAFWPAKTLLSAVELGLFTTLGGNAMTGAELERALGLHGRANPDFFDTLVALRFSSVTATAPMRAIAIRAETARFLDKNSPHYMGGFLEMANARLYRFWGDLTEALRTGKPQNETKHGGARCSRSCTASRNGSSSSWRRWRGSPRATSRRSLQQVRFLTLQDAVRRGRRQRSALHAGRAGASAHALHLRGPAGRNGHRRAEDRRSRAR